MSIQSAKVKSKCAEAKKGRLYTDIIYSTGMAVPVVRAGANGSVNALCTITYSGFSIYSGGVALDQRQTLWFDDSGNGALNAFPLGASAPTQIITGAKTNLLPFPHAESQRIAVDASGNVWVPEWYDYNAFFGYVVAFANGANGNAKPIATIGLADKGVSESIGAPIGLAFDREGRLYVAEPTRPGQVVIFAPPFKDNSRPVAIWSTNDMTMDARFVTIDSKDTVYVASQAKILAFDGGFKSNGVPTRTIMAPGNESFIMGITCDAKGQLYASTLTDPFTIYVLKAKATSWSPIRAITSPAFKDSNPETMAISL